MQDPENNSMPCADHSEKWRGTWVYRQPVIRNAEFGANLWWGKIKGTMIAAMFYGMWELYFTVDLKAHT